jgi:hypothetical protein
MPWYSTSKRIWPLLYERETFSRWIPAIPTVILATMGKQLEMAMLTPHLSLEDQAADPETTSL